MGFDILQDKICELNNPTVAGLDARLSHIPPYLMEESVKAFGNTIEAACDALLKFNIGIMDALVGVVPAIKPQAAYYELLGPQGMVVLQKTIAYAKEKGFYVIADIKRGDIGTTATAYAEAWLGSVDINGTKVEPFGADCCTVNGYMGSDAMNPFLNICKENNKAVFVLVKTSNPSSGDLQDQLIDGKSVYATMGSLIEKCAGDTVDPKYGYTPLGAVVGATYPEQLQEMRKQMQKTFFLVPGYGAQGGKAEDVQYAFDKNGHGAIINSSRGIFYAWNKTGNEGHDFGEAARNAALKMKEDILNYVKIQ